MTELQLEAMDRAGELIDPPLFRSEPRVQERVGALTDAITGLLEAQDALDNWECMGVNRPDYFVLMHQRNRARNDLDAVLAALTSQEKDHA